MKKILLISALTLTVILLFNSCNKEKRDYNKAKNSESLEELKIYITEYPNAIYVDSANLLIEEITWQQALLENRNTAYSEYLENYPDGRYVNEVLEQLAQKKENLILALKAFHKAQQANNEIEQVEFYSRADSLFELVNYTDFIFEAFKEPTINLHLDQEDKLSEIINRSFTTSRFLYGQPVTEMFTYNLSNEKINDYIFYKIILGSVDVTDIRITIQLIRNGKIISNLGEDNYTVSSNKYNSYIGFFHNDSINILPDDKLRFVINASGSNYGKSCGNNESYIKAVRPAVDLDNDVLAERIKAIEWCATSSKWSHPAAPLIDFIAQLDYCVLNDKSGIWDIGGGSQKDGQPYQVSWKNDSITIKKLTQEDADALGIKEYSTRFSIE